MTQSQNIQFAVEGHIARLTLNAPDTLNAINEEMHLALLQAILAIRGSSEVRVVLLTANGRAFSAGGDLDEVLRLQQDAGKRNRMCDIGQRLIEALIDLPVPVVTALHGDAIGLGASLALCSDIIVANASARLGDTHVKVGLVPGDGGCLAWPMSMGMNRAKLYLLTGELLPADRAYEFGLVSELTEDAAACVARAEALASTLAGLPPIAVMGTKRALNQQVKARAAEVFPISMAHEKESAASEDVVEAINAMKQRRKPQYQGK